MSIPNGGCEPIRFATAAAAEALRQRLICFLWSAGLPARCPDQVTRGVSAPAFAGYTNLDRIDCLAIHQPGAVDAIGYHLVPAYRIGRAVINQAGHDMGPLDPHNLRVSRRLVAAGFDVIALPMVHGYGLTTPERHGLSYHLEPPVVAINHLRSAYPEIPMAITGRSGGGWTTDWMAAIDTRISAAYPTAGSVPIPLRGTANGPSDPLESYGDWEQWTAEAYGGPNKVDAQGLPGVANYSELYVLGAIGIGRGVTQIINPNDGCCFHTDRRAGYAPAVKAMVATIGAGGHYDSILDPSIPGQHAISDGAVQAIIRHQRALAIGLDEPAWIGSARSCSPRLPVTYQLGYEAGDIVRIRIAAGVGGVEAVVVQNFSNASFVHPVATGGALADLVVRRLTPGSPLTAWFVAFDDCGAFPFVVTA